MRRSTSMEMENLASPSTCSLQKSSYLLGKLSSFETSLVLSLSFVIPDDTSGIVVGP